MGYRGGSPQLSGLLYCASFFSFYFDEHHQFILRCDLSFHEQVDRLVSQSAQTMYALRMLRSQGLSGPNLWEVAEATLVSRLSYASQVWWGMIRESERLQLNAVLGRAIKQGFLPPQHPSFSDICDSADHLTVSGPAAQP